MDSFSHAMTYHYCNYHTNYYNNPNYATHYFDTNNLMSHPVMVNNFNEKKLAEQIERNMDISNKLSPIAKYTVSFFFYLT